MNAKAVAIVIVAVLVVAGGGGAAHLLLKDKDDAEKLFFEPYVLKYGDRQVICIVPVNA